MSALVTLRRSLRRHVRVRGVGVLLTPIPDEPRGVVAQLHSDAEISAEFFTDLQRDLAARGYDRIRTNAIGERFAAVAHPAGFATVQRLALLERPSLAGDVNDPDVITSDVIVRHATYHASSPRARRLLDVCALIDAASFPATWSLDSPALRDAASATPRHRFFVARDTTADSPIVGYLMCGADSTHGFIQRLAVHPGHRNRGIARALLRWSLAWLQSLGVRSSWVNTEPDNATALQLYGAAGFRRQPTGLVVVEWRPA